jgi:hypothetical protein
VLASS